MVATCFALNEYFNKPSLFMGKFGTPFFGKISKVHPLPPLCKGGRLFQLHVIAALLLLLFIGNYFD